jgi:hypothetical protein
MDGVSTGKLAKASVDAKNLTKKVREAELATRTGDAATATSLLTSIVTANYPNLLGLPQIATLVASVALIDAHVRYGEALANNNNSAAIDAALAMLEATGSLIAAIGPSAQTKLAGSAIAISATATREAYKQQESIKEFIKDIGYATEILQSPLTFIDPQSAIDVNLIDPKTLLPRNPGVNSPTKRFEEIYRNPNSPVATSPTYRIVYINPLAIDLDGDGLETVGIGGTSTVVFEHDGDGLKTGTGWLKGEDAWLVRGLNGNGRIDSGAEMFGDQTLLPNGHKVPNLKDMGRQCRGAIKSRADKNRVVRTLGPLGQKNESCAEITTTRAHLIAE